MGSTGWFNSKGACIGIVRRLGIKRFRIIYKNGRYKAIW